MEVQPTVVFTFPQNLDNLIQECDTDPLYRVITKFKPPGSSMLEAGAGSGRWLAFLRDRGYQVVGIELNPDPVARFRAAFPGIQYDVGDVTRLPYPDQTFDLVLSLGVIEHLIDGPQTALAELRRVLKEDGVAVITVPMNNPLWKLQKVQQQIWYKVLGSSWLRKLLRRKPVACAPVAQKGYFQALSPRLIPKMDYMLSFHPTEGIQFYEYRFKQAQLLAVLQRSGFVVRDVSYQYSNQRLTHVFGSLVGRHIPGRDFSLNKVGSFLQAVLPQTWICHMLMVVVAKH